jgi:hypothetical protein
LVGNVYCGWLVGNVYCGGKKCWGQNDVNEKKDRSNKMMGQEILNVMPAFALVAIHLFGRQAWPGGLLEGVIV